MCGLGFGFTAIALAAVAAAAWYRSSQQAPKLTGKDTIVIADFANTTGDPVFDGALRQGLSAQLEQSPFLNLLSDQRSAETLALMSQPKDARLTHELALEVCQRTAGAAVLDGSIAQVGTSYLLTLRALDCSKPAKRLPARKRRPTTKFTCSSLHSGALPRRFAASWASRSLRSRNMTSVLST